MLLTDVHLPLLPLKYISVHLEADALGLDNVQWLHVAACLELLTLFLLVLSDEIWKEVVQGKRRRNAFPARRFERILVERRRRGARSG